MRTIRTLAALGAVVSCATAPAAAWSLLEEVTVVDASLSARMDFELPVAKPYCDSSPPNLDRTTCEISLAEHFWIGVDAAGNQYGVVAVSQPSGEFFDIMRRPPGTQLSELVLRITKRIEPIFGEVTKLQVSGAWAVDPANGQMTLSFRGQCLSAACSAMADTEEHLGTLRVSGLPDLFAIAATYEPPSAFSFRVPAVPFGLPTGSRIDVYTGALGTLPDLSLAQPLQCNVADALPPGVTIAVPDPLPDPGPGLGRYYLTTVTHGTETRAGRRTEGGMLVGRDPAGLPVCT